MMSNGTITNREEFLNSITSRLGRSSRSEKVQRPTWKNQPQYTVLDGYSQDELLDVLKEQCKIIHTDLIETTNENLVKTLKEVVDGYGGGPVAAWNDVRFDSYGLKPLLTEGWPNQGIDVNSWDPLLGDANRTFAEKANIGITFSDLTLAESGTVLLYSNSNNGRSVSLLPTNYIAIIPKSTIVARMTQATANLHQMVKTGEAIPSCVNFVTGPSNSADIEMKLVVGVHGPVRASYVVVADKKD
jgi:L-lactate dehydrogenase complex protein LldG